MKEAICFFFVFFFSHFRFSVVVAARSVNMRFFLTFLILCRIFFFFGGHFFFKSILNCFFAKYLWFFRSFFRPHERFSSAVRSTNESRVIKFGTFLCFHCNFITNITSMILSMCWVDRFDSSILVLTSMSGDTFVRRKMHKPFFVCLCLTAKKIDVFNVLFCIFQSICYFCFRIGYCA